MRILLLYFCTLLTVVTTIKLALNLSSFSTQRSTNYVFTPTGIYSCLKNNNYAQYNTVPRMPKSIGETMRQALIDRSSGPTRPKNRPS